MVTSKSLLGADQLLSALSSGDGTLVLSTLEEMEGQPPSKLFQELLESARKKVEDDILRFQLKVAIRLNNLRLEGKTKSGTADSFRALLEMPDQIEETALQLLLLAPSEAIFAIDHVRSSNWHEFPAPILPSFCSFFKKFGNLGDSPRLVELCRHPDPTVLTAALSCLEKIDPSNLQSLVMPLLTSPNPGIRARAIQNLYQWDKITATKYFVTQLFSKDVTEQTLALHYAAFFPFPEVEPHLLRFVSEACDPKLLMRVSNLMKANAHVELPFKLYWICRSLRDKHQNLVKGILIGVARSLADSGKIHVTAQEFLNQLKERVRLEEERLIKASFEIPADPAYGEETPEPEKGKSGKESRPSQAVEPPGVEPAAPETQVVEPAALETPAPDSTPAPEQPLSVSPQDFSNMDPPGRMKVLQKIGKSQFQELKPAMQTLVKTAKGKELAGILKAFGRFGTKEDAPLLKPTLTSDNPDEVCGAIDGLAALDSEFLAIYLPQLMQNRNGKIRMTATRAFVGIDRDCIRSLLASLLSSVNPKQRALGIPASMLVDFGLVRDSLITAFEAETLPELVEKMGLVLCANPDRELFRAVYRSWRRGTEITSETRRKVLDQLAGKLSIALEKIASPEELLAAEDDALKAEIAKKPPAPPAPKPGTEAAKPKVPEPTVHQILTSQDDESKTKRAKITVIVWIAAILLWGITIVSLLFKFVFAN